MEGKLLKYADLTKPQKRQVIAFIRKCYSCTQICIRDIITDRYQALLNDDKLTGVAFKL
jgi:hypothetical protein